MSRLVERHQHESSTFLAIGIRQIVPAIFALVVKQVITAPFDSSHVVVSGETTPGLRWDAIHFTSIALDGYQYEQQLAFMPLLPLYMRITGELGTLVRVVMSKLTTVHLPLELTYHDVAGMVAGPISQGINWFTAIMLYKLTRQLTGSHRFASLTCAFYTFSPMPAASAAPYTEPLYALFTFSGFYYTVRSRHTAAAILLAFATATRAMGIFNIGVLGWHVLFGNRLPGASNSGRNALLRRGLSAIPLCLLVIAPFLAFQYYAYTAFCFDPKTVRPWCSAKIPLPYNFVQAEYWNNGLFNYWTAAQIPNFLLAAPVLLVSIFPTISYFRSLFDSKRPDAALPARQTALLPFHIQHAFLTMLLIFGSHTQIALRLSLTNPVVWWNVTSMAFDRSTWYAPATVTAKSKIDVRSYESKDDSDAPSQKERARMTLPGKMWTAWVVVWGAASVMLWAGHYPPA